jgi:hypothetical protein
LIKYAPEAAVDTLRSLGLEDIELGMFKEDEDLPPERTSAISYLSRLFGEGRIPEENLAPALEAAKKGDLAGALIAAEIKPDVKGVTSLGMSHVLPFLGSQEAQMEYRARNATYETKVEHHAVLNTTGINEWEIVNFDRAKALHKAGKISKKDLDKFTGEITPSHSPAAPTVDKLGTSTTSGGFRY